MGSETPSGPLPPIEPPRSPGGAPPDTPPEMVGRTEAPSGRRGYTAYVAAQIGIYVVVAAMVLVLLIVNVGVAYFGWGQTSITLFAADGDFLLAAAAVLVIVFEVRREVKGRREAKGRR